MNGYGKFVDQKGQVYEGQWRDSRRHGRGVFIDADGSRYEGGMLVSGALGLVIIYVLCVCVRLGGERKVRQRQDHAPQWRHVHRRCRATSAVRLYILPLTADM